MQAQIGKSFEQSIIARLEAVNPNVSAKSHDSITSSRSYMAPYVRFNAGVKNAENVSLQFSRSDDGEWNARVSISAFNGHDDLPRAEQFRIVADVIEQCEKIAANIDQDHLEMMRNAEIEHDHQVDLQWQRERREREAACLVEASEFAAWMTRHTGISTEVEADQIWPRVGVKAGDRVIGWVDLSVSRIEFDWKESERPSGARTTRTFKSEAALFAKLPSIIEAA